jgi:hypothetical protein
MTAIACDTPVHWAQAAQDRGVSQTESVWAGLARDVFRVSPSIAGTQVADLFQLIDKAAADASRPNWDGEGAWPVEGTTRTFARMFATALPADTLRPEVSVDRDGDISFEWYQSPQSVFSVSIRRDGILHYAGLFGPNKSHGSEVLDRGIPDPIAHGIRRVRHGI